MFIYHHTGTMRIQQGQDDNENIFGSGRVYLYNYGRYIHVLSQTNTLYSLLNFFILSPQTPKPAEYTGSVSSKSTLEITFVYNNAPDKRLHLMSLFVVKIYRFCQSKENYELVFSTGTRKTCLMMCVFPRAFNQTSLYIVTHKF